MRHNLVKALRGVPAFGALDDRTLLRLFGAASNLWWREGSTVFEAGDPGDALFIVLSGEVSVLGSVDGEEMEVRREGPGGFFGERSLFGERGRSKTVRCLCDTQLMVIPRASFEAILAADRDLASHFERVFEEQAAAYGT